MLKDPTAGVFVPLEQLRDVCRQIAIAVGIVAEQEGLVPKSSMKEIERRVDEKMWYPEYPMYRRKP
jgi:malate dehydrogenase (oxaloacetate-decarboxylating)